MKLNKQEQTAFAAIGDCIVKAKALTKLKKDLTSEIRAVLDTNKDAFASGVTIGKYKFQTTTRVELGAIEV